MSFREVLDLDICPEGVSRDYGNHSYKGGWGVLIEERYFGYKANSSREADLSDIGVEIKATCIDILKSGKLTAGERLSLTMIPYDEEVPASLYDSHLWKKCRQLLLIWYVRVKDKSADPYQQRIRYVSLFTPPAKDMPIIEADYALITGLVRDGRADELSESLTTYLGAATKGAGGVRSIVPQAFYAPGKKARKRTFAYKQSYMRYVLHHYVMGEPEPESIVSNTSQLAHTSLVSYVTKIINAHVGKSDRRLCDELGIKFSRNKAQWTTIAYRLLGLRKERAEEFDKASIRVRTVRPEQGLRRLEEHVPFLNIDFKALAREDDWQDSELRRLLVERTFLFVVFEKTDAIPGATSVLRGCFA
jgi:DNA mismatch repair protein MutH